MESKILHIVDVKGTPFQRGRDQGEGAKELIHTALDRYRKIVPAACRCSWEEILQKAQIFLPPTEDSFPDVLEELRGLAEGAGAPFEEIWVLNCYQELQENHPGSSGCTSLAVSADHTVNRHVYLAHNEDWLSADHDTVYLVRSKPDDGPAFIGMTYGPLLVNIGMNEKGIAVTINSVFATDTQIGVPRILYSRDILKAQSIEEALQKCLPQNRAGGYHYLLGDRLGRLYSVESSASHHHILPGEPGWLVHTNHYLSAEMSLLETKHDLRNSQLRLQRAKQLLEPQQGSLNIEFLQTLLRDHVNDPDAICGHEDPSLPPQQSFITIVSLIMDLTESVIWASPGPPCQSTYHAYSL